MGLIEAGVVTNACKGIDSGVSVAGGLLGSQKRLLRHIGCPPRLRPTVDEIHRELLAEYH